LLACSEREGRRRLAEFARVERLHYLLKEAPREKEQEEGKEEME